MYNRNFSRISINLLVITAFILVLSGVFFSLTQNATANEPQDTSAGNIPLGSSITYQGELEKDGSPVNDTCSMRFQLYDEEIGGNTASSQLTQNVTVNDGIFTVELDFGSDPFAGDARYLNIAVQCTDEGNYTSLGSRITLNATPYALSLRPGADIVGDLSANDTLEVANKDTGYDSVAIYGRSGLPTGITSSNGIGVRGDGHGTTGVGGYTWTGTGVMGFAQDDAATNYGVVGLTNSPNGYGVYSQGNAHVDGNLTWQAKTSYVSIPAAGFAPFSNEGEYGNYGEVINPSGSSPAASFLAPVYLPHNAIIQNITFYWYDVDNFSDADLRLYRNGLDGLSQDEVITLVSSGNAGGGSSTESVINYATIDNSQYSYYLFLYMPSTGLGLYNVVIEYTTTQPH